VKAGYKYPRPRLLGEILGAMKPYVTFTSLERREYDTYREFYIGFKVSDVKYTDMRAMYNTLESIRDFQNNEYEKTQRKSYLLEFELEDQLQNVDKIAQLLGYANIRIVNIVPPYVQPAGEKTNFLLEVEIPVNIDEKEVIAALEVYLVSVIKTDDNSDDFKVVEGSLVDRVLYTLLYEAQLPDISKQPLLRDDFREALIRIGNLSKARKSRKYSYMSHFTEVVKIIANEYNMREPDVLLSGLLHDIIEEELIDKKTFIKVFGYDLYRIVDLLTRYEPREKGGEARYFRRMFNDPHATRRQKTIALLVKIADRTHNLRSLNVGDRDFERKIYFTTLDTFVNEVLKKIELDKCDVDLRSAMEEAIIIVRKQIIKTGEDLGFIDASGKLIKEEYDAFYNNIKVRRQEYAFMSENLEWVRKVTINYNAVDVNVKERALSLGQYLRPEIQELEDYVTTLQTGAIDVDELLFHEKKIAELNKEIKRQVNGFDVLKVYFTRGAEDSETDLINLFSSLSLLLARIRRKPEIAKELVGKGPLLIMKIKKAKTLLEKFDQNTVETLMDKKKITDGVVRNVNNITIEGVHVKSKKFINITDYEDILAQVIREAQDRYFGLVTSFQAEGGHLFLTDTEDVDCKNNNKICVPIQHVEAARKDERAFELLIEEIIVPQFSVENEFLKQHIINAAFNVSLNEFPVSHVLFDFMERWFWHWRSMIKVVNNHEELLYNAQQVGCDTNPVFLELIKRSETEPQAYLQSTFIIALYRMRTEMPGVDTETQEKLVTINDYFDLLLEDDFNQLWKEMAVIFAQLEDEIEAQRFSSEWVTAEDTAIDLGLNQKNMSRRNRIQALRLLRKQNRRQKLSINVGVSRHLKQNEMFSVLKNIIKMASVTGINITIVDVDTNPDLILAGKGEKELGGNNVVFFTTDNIDTLVAEIALFRSFFIRVLAESIQQNGEFSIDLSLFNLAEKSASDNGFVVHSKQGNFSKYSS